MEPQRFLKSRDHLGDQIGLQRGCINQAQRRGFQGLKLCAEATRDGRNTTEENDEQRQNASAEGLAQQGATNYASAPVNERDDRGRAVSSQLTVVGVTHARVH